MVFACIQAANWSTNGGLDSPDDLNMINDFEQTLTADRASRSSSRAANRSNSINDKFRFV